MGIFLLVLGLALFVSLVVVHEFGHFIVARRNGVEVEEFGIGFPPRAWVRRIHSVKGPYDFTINWLPLGGFVRLKGEHDADKTPGSFGAASLGVKVRIMLAGVALNLVTAIVLLTFAALIGIPKLIPDQFTVGSDTKVVRQDILVGYIEPDSPAQKAGLQQKDKLIAFGNKEDLSDGSNFSEITKRYAGRTALLTYERQGTVKTVDVPLRSTEEVEKSKNTDNPKGYLGMAVTDYTVQKSTWSAPIVALGLTKQFTELTFKGLGTALASLFRGDTAKASEQVSGPVGIFVILKDGTLLGFQFILLIIAVISLTLAIMNVLPIPALDGGRLFVTLLFRATGRQLTKRREDLIHGTGFAALMLLFVLVTIIDVKRFF